VSAGRRNSTMTKFSILICALLLVGCANAQDLCTVAKAVIPSAFKCTGTGAKATLSVDLSFPYGVDYTSGVPTGIKSTTMTFAIAQSPCSPASASATISDSQKAFLSAPQTVAIKDGLSTKIALVPKFAFPVIGDVSINLVVTLTGGIDNFAGLSFQAAVSICAGTLCDNDVYPSGTIGSALKALMPSLPLAIAPKMTIPTETFTKDQLNTLCPPPPVTTKASDSSMLHASLALAGVAIAAVVA